MSEQVHAQAKALRANFRRIERREWWLWASAFVITLGEQIPMSARIFDIADTLDAVTSERPYQRASSFESAREIIRRLSGTAFDPQVVNVFLNIREDVWPTIASNQRRIAGLSPELRRNPSMLRIGLGLMPD